MDLYYSRLNLSELYYSDSKFFFSLPRPLNIKYRVDDIFYTALSNDRLDTIAYKIWGDAKLWWIIPLYNGIVDPFEDITGMTLRLPSMITITMDLLRV